MSELKNEVRRRSYALKHHQMMTVENIVIVGAVIFALMWLWGSISAITRNWELAQEVANRRYEKMVLELEIDNLELENEYYSSVEYQELAARKYQSKMLDGETMIYLPNNSESARNSYNLATLSVKQEQKSNFEQWMQFLFRI